MNTRGEIQWCRECHEVRFCDEEGRCHDCVEEHAEKE